ncbi:MAG: type I methionyl aminopeptidase [Thermodesulfobacteriota bacterium]
MAKTIVIKSDSEIEKMFAANQIVAATLSMLQERMEPGLSTWQMDRWAEKYCRRHGAVPAFKGYRGFPGSLCVSINEQVVHGIPSKKVKVREGDVISIDFGVRIGGFYGDSAITLPVGKVEPEIEQLLAETQQSLYRAISQAVSGNRVDDVSSAVESHVEQFGYGIVRQFVGHGIGKELHEPPEIPNYHRDGVTPKLLPGMTLAIEPMINLGTGEVQVLKDGWTVITRDRKYSAHFEHSVAVTQGKALILSRREDEALPAFLT